MIASLQPVAEHLLLPPGLGVVLTVFGVLLWRADWRGGGPLLAVGLLALVLPSLEGVSQRIADTLERDYREAVLAVGRADAIVVLGGGRASGRGLDGGQDDLNAATYERVRHAARLHAETGLPLLVSGGSPRARPGRRSEAELMAIVLERDHGVRPRWVEGTSRNTCENAQHTRQRLQRSEIRRVLVVTHAIHMPRALDCFTRAGLPADPAPMGFRGTTREPARVTDWLPSADAYATAAFALREWYAHGFSWVRARFPDRGPTGG